MEAVTAFHEHQDGSTDGTYDTAVADCVLGMVKDGTLTWDEAMQSASSDAARLALLDGASTISRTLRSFVDDTRVAIASWGEAAVAVDVLERVASEDQYVYKQGKNKVVVNNFARRRPLQLQGSEVEFADQHVQLGIVLDTRYDGRAHLHHILSRGSSKMHLLLLELSTLGLPMHALLLSVRTRMLPSVAFGVELVVHTPCSDKQLNSMQASWKKKISGCALVPRVVLLWELGFQDRLSAIAWARAIMLRRRSAADPRYSHENSILSYAEVEPSSWPAAVQAKESYLAIPPFTGVVSPLTPAKTKAQLGHHARTVVVPHVRAHEMKTWHHSSKNRLYWKDFSPVNWTILCAPPSCRLCGSSDAETVRHLLFQCDVAMRFFAHVPAWTDSATRVAVGSSLSGAREVLPWLEAAGKLLRHVQKRAAAAP